MYPNVSAFVYIHTLTVLVVSVLGIGEYSYLVCKEVVLIIPNMKFYPIQKGIIK